MSDRAMGRVTIWRPDGTRETRDAEPDEPVVIYGACAGVNVENLGDGEMTYRLEFRGGLVVPPISVITRDA